VIVGRTEVGAFTSLFNKQFVYVALFAGLVQLHRSFAAGGVFLLLK